MQSNLLKEDLIQQKDATIQAQKDAAGKEEKIQQLEASLVGEAANHQAAITKVKEAESHITEMKERLVTQEKVRCRRVHSISYSSNRMHCHLAAH